MIDNPIERSYSLLAAEATLTGELDKLGYNYKFQMAGNDVYTCKCTITQKESGIFLAAGNGKGEQLASRVGSLFEATEHLFSHNDSVDPGKLTYLDSSEFCQGNNMCDTLPLATLKGNKNSQIPFLEYKAVNGQSNCLYPLALVCPSYIDSFIENHEPKRGDSLIYQRLEQYSSNSGTAIGMNAEEAIIHGLLESVERTSLSVFLAKTFLLRAENNLRVIDPITLPSKLIDVFIRTEKELGNKILIFEMPNKFGIPAYCSWLEQYSYKVGFAGYGCSLSIENAILRSINELAQYYLLSKHLHGFEWLKKLDVATLAQLEGLPLHQDCAKFDLGSKCKEQGYELLRYSDQADHKFSKNPVEYLGQLTDIIYSSGEVPFTSVLHVLGNGINISHSFVTGEDRFFNVRSGKSTFPMSLANG